MNLDEAVLDIRCRSESWKAAGLDVGDVTWRDQAEPWPPSLKTDRRLVEDADSVGVRLTKGTAEGQVVLFRGGWADFEFRGGLANDEAVLDAPETIRLRSSASFSIVWLSSFARAHQHRRLQHARAFSFVNTGSTLEEVRRAQKSAPEGGG